MNDPPVLYSSQRRVLPDDYADLLRRCSLGSRRPVDDPARIGSMLDNANLHCSAWVGDRLVGMARSLTDFAYCCYLADLSVDEAWQRRGIGKELVRLTRSSLHPAAKIVLLAAPGAEEYYPRIGFIPHLSAWTLPAGE